MSRKSGIGKQYIEEKRFFKIVVPTLNILYCNNLDYTIYRYISELSEPSDHQIRAQIEAEKPWVQRVVFDTKALGNWDSSLLSFLIRVKNHCEPQKVSLDTDGLPQGVERLFKLAIAVPEKKDTGRGSTRKPFLARVGEDTIVFFQSTGEMLAFIGEAIREAFDPKLHTVYE